jgi:hypothetical protein
MILCTCYMQTYYIAKYRQCRHNAALMHSHVTVAAPVCVCSLSYPANKSNAPIYNVCPKSKCTDFPMYELLK